MSFSTRTHWFIRACALVAFLACALHTFQSLVQTEEPTTLAPVLLLLGVLTALAGIAGLYSQQRDSEDYWMVGVVASLAGFAGIAFVLVGAVLEDLLGPPVQQETPFEQLLGQFVPLFLIIGALMASIGVVVLGGVILASGVRLPRWCGALIIAASPPIVFFLTIFLAVLAEMSETNGLLFRLMFALVGVAWALVAYALFLRAKGRRSEQRSVVV